MVKTSANNIAKSKKKITKSYENRLGKIHLNFSKNRLKKSLFQVLFILSGMILALIILEISLRVSTKKNYTLDPCSSLDKDFHHILIASSECRFKTAEWDIENKFNSFGQRDNQISMEKPDNVLRILALGDSFTMGHGVRIEDSFVNILESKLNLYGRNMRVDVINSGVFGYSPLVEYLYLDKKGLSFKPDMVILFFSLTDFWDDRRRFEELKLSYPSLSEEALDEKIAKGEVEFKFDLINAGNSQNAEAEALPVVSDSLKQWFRDHFKTYATFADFVKKRNKVVQQDAIYQGDIDRDIVALVRGAKISDSDWEKLWKEPVLNLKRSKNLLEGNKIPFIVVLIPDAFQVSDKEWPNRTALGLGEHFEDTRGNFQDELTKRLEGEGIQFIDLLPYFKESSAFPLYFTSDGHFREAGHRLAAEIIFEKIKDNVKQ